MPLQIARKVAEIFIPVTYAISDSETLNSGLNLHISGPQH